MFHTGFEKVAVGSRMLVSVLNHAYGDRTQELSKKMKTAVYKNLPSGTKSSFESRLSGLYDRNEKARSLMSKYENAGSSGASRRGLMRTVIKDIRESQAIPKNSKRLIPGSSGNASKYLAIGGLGIAAAAGIGYLAHKSMSSNKGQPEQMVENNYDVPEHLKKDPRYSLLAEA
jgi:hypothetical protein